MFHFGGGGIQMAVVIEPCKGATYISALQGGVKSKETLEKGFSPEFSRLCTVPGLYHVYRLDVSKPSDRVLTLKSLFNPD